MAHRLREVLDIAEGEGEEGDFGGEDEVGGVHDLDQLVAGEDLEGHESTDVEAVGEGGDDLVRS